MTYWINHDAFSIQSEARDYWLGFLCADGYIHEKGVALQLARKDRTHLTKFQTFLECGHPVIDLTTAGSIKSRGRPLPASRIRITSRKIANDLMAHGLSKKSLNRTASEELQLSRHFWRGLVDGDGSIGIYKKRYTDLQLSLCGGELLVNQFKQFLNENGVSTKCKVTKLGAVHVLQLYSRVALRTAELLYTNNVVCLDRKYAIVQKAIALYKTKRIMSKNTIHVATPEAIAEGYGQTKYGVLEVGDEDYSGGTLRSKTGAVTCPVCQEALCPAEQFGGLLVCPKHGTAPFETTR